jgi:hypothetical protein
MGVRECPFCGKSVSDQFRDCPHCHETLPQQRVQAASSAPRAKSMMRRGLTYMLVLVLIYYVISDRSPIKLSLPFTPLLTDYVLPLFFVVSLGITLYGLFKSVRG